MTYTKEQLDYMKIYTSDEYKDAFNSKVDYWQGRYPYETQKWLKQELKDLEMYLSLYYEDKNKNNFDHRDKWNIQQAELNYNAILFIIRTMERWGTTWLHTNTIIF